MSKTRVLILCTGNSARSQMAEGLLRHDAGNRFEVVSAGVDPAVRVRPEAVAVMKELRIDISGHRPRHVNEFIGQPFDFVLTVCDHAHETCPVFPGPTVSIHHSFVDPAACLGSEEERLELFRKVRDQIRKYLGDFAGQIIGTSGHPEHSERPGHSRCSEDTTGEYRDPSLRSG
jgi:arsenate reductase (thioredoxin)